MKAYDLARWHPLAVLGFAGHIRPPDHDETPLSPDECWIAIREGYTTTNPAPARHQPERGTNP